jgi:hypothetical protein
VKGHVSHDEFFSLRGARVEVTVGAAREVTLTDADGRFMFDGLPGGDAEVTATKDGYVPSVQRVHVTRDVDLDFALKPFGYIDITGTYSLRMTAAAECRDNLPEAVRTRTYTAVVTRERGRFHVTLSGADFNVLGNAFQGWIVEQGVWFETYYYDDGGRFDVVSELLTPSTILAIQFFVQATVSPTSLVGTMDGVFNIYRRVGDVDFVVDASCRSDSHQFLMSRR